jgi:hypothetical protein
VGPVKDWNKRADTGTVHHRSVRKAGKKTMKLMLKIAGGIVIGVVLLTVGCAALLSSSVKEATKKKTWIVRVNAPAGRCWSGAMGNRTVDGCGSKVVRVRDIAITSANAQKQSAGHWRLKLTLLKDGRVVDSASTTAVYGIADITGSDF